ncbi:hypothetical protein KM043_014605 [Ampulex compressa]|nr:hypothetical protein KM043_014605 [Ampulex compressa]
MAGANSLAVGKIGARRKARSSKKASRIVRGGSRSANNAGSGGVPIVARGGCLHLRKYLYGPSNDDASLRVRRKLPHSSSYDRVTTALPRSVVPPLPVGRVENNARPTSL